jgi:hypothetical protein
MRAKNATRSADVANDARLLEVEQRGRHRREQHDARDAQEVGIGEQRRQRAQHAPADRLALVMRERPAAMALRPAHEAARAGGASLEKQRGGEERCARADVAQDDGEQRTDEAAEAPAGGDGGEEPCALLRRERVGHEAPERRHDEEAVDRRPDVEAARQQHGIDVEARRQREAHEPERERMVGDGHDVADGQSRDERRERGDDEQRRDEGRREHPGQQLDAALDAHRVAHRPDGVPAREQEQEVDEGPRDGSALLGSDVRHDRHAAGTARARCWFR